MSRCTIATAPNAMSIFEVVLSRLGVLVCGVAAWCLVCGVSLYLKTIARVSVTRVAPITQRFTQVAAQLPLVEQIDAQRTMFHECGIFGTQRVAGAFDAWRTWRTHFGPEVQVVFGDTIPSWRVAPHFQFVRALGDSATFLHARPTRRALVACRHIGGGVTPVVFAKRLDSRPHGTTASLRLLVWRLARRGLAWWLDWDWWLGRLSWQLGCLGRLGRVCDAWAASRAFHSSQIFQPPALGIRAVRTHARRARRRPSGHTRSTMRTRFGCRRHVAGRRTFHAIAIGAEAGRALIF